MLAGVFGRSVGSFLGFRWPACGVFLAGWAACGDIFGTGRITGSGDGLEGPGNRRWKRSLGAAFPGPAASWAAGPGGGSLPLYIGPCSPAIVRNNANLGNLCSRGCVLTCDMNYAFLMQRSIDVCVEGVDVESAPIVNSRTVCTLVKQSKRSEKVIQSRRLK